MRRAKDDSAARPNLVMRYETLRSAALGDALPLEARAGMMLFLRRGMWGWARALASMSAFEEPTGSRASNWKAPKEYKTVIHILAAMAIRTTREGATP
jgi:hypothetical protein